MVTANVIERSSMKKRYKCLVVLFVLVLLGFVFPEPRVVPVDGATSSDWHKDSFWYEPWGTSGVHKGVDIFARKGESVVAPTNLILLYKGSIAKGGKIIVALGPKWRLHYFAHLDSIKNDAGLFALAGSELGGVGDTGNAKGKQPHLHYSVVSLLPMPWRIDDSTQGVKKAFYLNPITYFSPR